jgi:polysaccharide biosynthesis PFTS motif protein
MVLIVGPILFQKKELKIKHPSKFIITYFDVDPYINLERKGSDYYTFYTEDKMINLLKSCLKSIEALPSSVAQIIQLQCKPKKILSKGRSKKYAKYRNDAFKKISGNVLPVDANLYSIVSESDLVIGVPYASPVELAREMGTERAFVAFGMDVDHLLPNMWNKTEVIKEIDNLTELILDLVTKKF